MSSPYLVPQQASTGGNTVFLKELRSLLESAKGDCRDSFMEFFRAYPPAMDYTFGRHTQFLIAEMQRITERVNRGESVYKILTLPFRHGKSDVSSRRFPAWVMARDPEAEVAVFSASYDLAAELNTDARNIFKRATAEGRLGNYKMSKDRDRRGSWGIQNHKGASHALGLGGTLVGRGAKYAIVDDYFKSREDAESPNTREKVWIKLMNDVFNRLAPVHAIVIVANRWHEDDPVGRIKAKNDPNNPKYDPNFPVFEEVIFRMKDGNKARKGGRGGNATKDNPDGWLFPERFPPAWYIAQRAVMGSYAWAAQAQGDPQHKGGNMLKTDMIKIVDELPPGLKYYRGWDLASSDKELDKPDPDYTWSTKAAYDQETIFVEDIVRGQWETNRRNAIMRHTISDDGSSVSQRMEAVAGYVDTRKMLSKEFEGMIKITQVNPRHNKIANAACLEGPFESGRVVLKRASWNQEWIDHFSAFPNGAHDDGVDSLVIAVGHLIRERINEIKTTPFKFGKSWA